MGAIESPVRRKPVPCFGCGEPIWETYNAQCDHCHMVGYLIFRHAVDWPLDEYDMVRLGLKQPKEEPSSTPTSTTRRRKGGKASAS
jgi:hypothetical protein